MAKRTFPNRIPGTCAACGVHVDAGEGFAFRSREGWKVSCKSSVCGDKLGLRGETKRQLTADGRVVMDYDPNALPLLRALPGARWNPKDKCWTVSLAVGDRPRLLELAAKLHLEVQPSLLKVDDGSEKLREKLTAAGLYPFQVDGVCWLRNRTKALLGDDMGTGKTVQTLLALPEKARAIVVCPASLKLNWRNECTRWRPDLQPVVLSGRGSFRLPAKGEVIVTNYDILPKTKKEGKQTVLVDKLDLSGIVLICDEATAAKSRKAARSKSVRALSATASKVWFLTGTPMLNRPFDLYGVLSSGGMEREVFGGWTTFLRCFQGYQNTWGGYEFGEPLPETPERLRRVMLRRTKEEVLRDLPPITYQDLVVNGLSKGLCAELDKAWASWGDYDRDELPPFEKFSEIRTALAAERIPAMLELVEQYEEAGEPLVVFSAHRAPVDCLGEREGWMVVHGDLSLSKRDEAVQKFQKGELKGIALTITAGGMGLTLTRASHVLFVDLDWTPAWNAQAIDRIRRIGQNADKIHVIRLISDHVLDQHVFSLLSQKTATIFKAIEAEAQYLRKDSGQWLEESEDAQRARKEAIEKAAREAAEASARQRIQNIIRQEKERQNTAPGEALELTPEVRDALFSALAYMKSVCDGAEARDGEGFSKPDVSRTAFLYDWMASGEETAFRAAALILCRYSRQLRERFPVLWG